MKRIVLLPLLLLAACSGGDKDPEAPAATGGASPAASEDAAAATSDSADAAGAAGRTSRYTSLKDCKVVDDGGGEDQGTHHQRPDDHRDHPVPQLGEQPHEEQHHRHQEQAVAHPLAGLDQVGDAGPLGEHRIGGGGVGGRVGHRAEATEPRPTHPALRAARRTPTPRVLAYLRLGGRT